jgi:hypothetical protein
LAALLYGLRRIQGYLLDGLSMEAHEPVELGAVGQGGKRPSQMASA